jgi:hypothetical protein
VAVGGVEVGEVAVGEVADGGVTLGSATDGEMAVGRCCRGWRSGSRWCRRYVLLLDRSDGCWAVCFLSNQPFLLSARRYSRRSVWRWAWHSAWRFIWRWAWHLGFALGLALGLVLIKPFERRWPHCGRAKPIDSFRRTPAMRTSTTQIARLGAHGGYRPQGRLANIAGRTRPHPRRPAGVGDTHAAHDERSHKRYAILSLGSAAEEDDWTHGAAGLTFGKAIACLCRSEAKVISASIHVPDALAVHAVVLRDVSSSFYQELSGADHRRCHHHRTTAGDDSGVPPAAATVVALKEVRILTEGDFVRQTPLYQGKLLAKGVLLCKDIVNAADPHHSELTS